MERGTAFLKTQIRRAVTQHRAFLDMLVDHEKGAEDERYRALCAGVIPKSTSHQQMLEAYQSEIEADTDTAAQATDGKAEASGLVLADAGGQNDFLRLGSDLVCARQCEDTFRTFRDAGRSLGLRSLATLGELAERDHDAYAKEANALAQAMFVERVREGDTSELVFSSVPASPANGSLSGNSQG